MNQKVYSVESHHSAEAVGSGGLKVLSTPMLIAYFENFAYEYLQEQLEPGLTSVGGYLEIKHLAPTHLNDHVTIQIESHQHEGKKVLFKMHAKDSSKTIAQVKHERFIVDANKFMKFN